MHINFLSLLSNLVLPSCYFLLSLTLCYLFVVSIVRVNFIISTYFGKFAVCFALIVQLQGGDQFSTLGSKFSIWEDQFFLKILIPRITFWGDQFFHDRSP